MPDRVREVPLRLTVTVPCEPGKPMLTVTVPCEPGKPMLTVTVPCEPGKPMLTVVDGEPVRVGERPGIATDHEPVRSGAVGRDADVLGKGTAPARGRPRRG
ncbi:hypothetical protein [Streptosporangium sp. NBC_01755]|uniref:hypothetical protein n=1 Tax=Streptosporangium sp. NBC_01755 TaxID=2975949 RepID=UPI003FA38235